MISGSCTRIWVLKQKIKVKCDKGIVTRIWVLKLKIRVKCDKRIVHGNMGTQAEDKGEM